MLAFFIGVVVSILVFAGILAVFCRLGYCRSTEKCVLGPKHSGSNVHQAKRRSQYEVEDQQQGPEVGTSQSSEKQDVAFPPPIITPPVTMTLSVSDIPYNPEYGSVKYEERLPLNPVRHAFASSVSDLSHHPQWSSDSSQSRGPHDADAQATLSRAHYAPRTFRMLPRTYSGSQSSVENRTLLKHYIYDVSNGPNTMQTHAPTASFVAAGRSIDPSPVTSIVLHDITEAISGHDIENKDPLHTIRSTPVTSYASTVIYRDTIDRWDRWPETFDEFEVFADDGRVKRDESVGPQHREQIETHQPIYPPSIDCFNPPSLSDLHRPSDSEAMISSPAEDTLGYSGKKADTNIHTSQLSCVKIDRCGGGSDKPTLDLLPPASKAGAFHFTYDSLPRGVGECTEH